MGTQRKRRGSVGRVYVQLCCVLLVRLLGRALCCCCTESARSNVTMAMERRRSGSTVLTCLLMRTVGKTICVEAVRQKCVPCYGGNLHLLVIGHSA